MTDLRDRLQAALGDAFTVERELGGGGMSHVFLATERRFDRQVVIKLLPPDVAGGVHKVGARDSGPLLHYLVQDVEGGAPHRVGSGSSYVDWLEVED